MDDKLFERFLSGDPSAATGVRNHLRAVAARVLEAPQWSMQDAQKRREYETAAVAETLQAPGRSMVQAASRVMTIATRIGLSHLRSSEGLGKDHIDVDLLAKKAMDSLPDDQEEVVRQYLSTCPICSRHLEAARSALKSAISNQQKAIPRPNPGAMRPGAPKTFHSASTKRLRTPRTKKHPKLTKAEGLSAGDMVTAAFIVVAIGLLVFLLMSPTGGSSNDEKLVKRMGLLEPELPPTLRANEFDSTIEVAIRLTEQGNCADSAEKLSRFVERDPESRLLRYYYSLALLCDRNEGALESFHTMKRMDGERFVMEDWWYAQALFLGDAVEHAEKLLEDLSQRTLENGNPHRRQDDARALLRRIRN